MRGLNPPPKAGSGRPAERERQDHRSSAIQESVATGGERNEPLEARFVDLDVACRRSENAPAVNEESLGRIGSDRHLAGDRDRRAVKHAAVDLHAARILIVEAVTAPEIE